MSICPEIADDDTLAAGVFLATYFAASIKSMARGDGIPSPTDTLDEPWHQDPAPLLEMTMAVMGHEPGAPKKAATARFFAAWADLIVHHGAELQMVAHQIMKPDEPPVAALVLSKEEAEALAEKVSGA